MMNLLSIEARNRELRLLTFYRIIHECVNLSLPKYIQQSLQSTRGNHLKYIQPSTRVDANKFSFYPSV